MSDRQDGIFLRSDFRWDSKRGVYICPSGKRLRTSGTVHDGRTLLYRASKHDCDKCPIGAKCCTTDQARKIPRDLHEDARDVARRKMKTKAFARSWDERKRVEMRFAHLKTHHGFERMRLRGLSGARDEFHLAAIVQNLKTLALRILGPPPVRRRASFA
jgi:Transposase DDE domain